MHGLTPYELLHGTPPKQDTLRVFGCLCYAQRQPRNSDKFSARSHKSIFVGYPYSKKAWNVYDLEENVFFTSRDVVFFEDQFPRLPPSHVTPMHQHDFAVDEWLSLPSPAPGPPTTTTTSTIPTTTTPTIPTTTTPIEQTLQPSTTNPIETTLPVSPSAPIEPVLPTSTTPTNTTDTSPHPTTTTPQASPTASQLPPNVNEPLATPPSPGLPEILGRGQRQRQPSVLLKNYVVNTVGKNTHTLVPPDSTPGSYAVSGNSLYPLVNYVSDAKFSARHKAFVTAITSAVEPKSYAEAVEIEEWRLYC